ncbi:Aldehyde dehydrogenase [Mycena kentingensis (nom. inval.)]|nr:Aldehyde dehydrogenase [Mycena kentingensis (nom. inval.)]
MKRGFLKAQEPHLGPTAQAPVSQLPSAASMRLTSPIAGTPPNPPSDLASKFRTLDPGEKPSPTSKYIVTRIPPYNSPDVTNAECLFVHGTKDLLLDTTPDFPKPVPAQPDVPAFRVAPSPGKGAGLFSTRALKQGELILAERPLVVTPEPAAWLFTPAMQAEYDEDFRGQVEVVLGRVEDHNRETFMALCDSSAQPALGSIVGRIRTNSIEVGGLIPNERGTYRATCALISRLNHSCSPNTQPKFDKQSFSFSLYAVRDIPIGEELTLQYTDALASKADRAKALSSYGFQCNCSACTDPTADQRRATIGTYSPDVAAWVNNPAVSDDMLRQNAMKMTELLEADGLQHLPQYYIASRTMLQAYVALGDVQRASQWAKRLKAICWVVGELFGAADDLEELMNPKSRAYQQHGLWRVRIDKRQRRKQARYLESLARPAPKPKSGSAQDKSGRKYDIMSIGARNEEKSECGFVPGTMELLRQTRGFPKALPPQPSPRAFRVDESRGKGLGLFSTRKIEQGETILVERPLLVNSVGGVRSDATALFTKGPDAKYFSSMEEWEDYIRVLVERLEPKRRAAFLELHNSHTHDGSGPLVGIVRTNGVGVEGLIPGKTGYEGSYSATCELISRLNHSLQSSIDGMGLKKLLSETLIRTSDGR